MAKIIDLVTNAGQVDVTKGIVEEALKAAPEMSFFDSDTIPGTTIATLARTTLPTVAFRNIGDPVSSSRSQYAERQATLKLLSGRAEITEAEVKKNPLLTKDEQCVSEAIAVLTASFQHLGKQIWYGTGSDAKGFSGATQLVDASMVTRAGNGTSNANTSVWFVGNDVKTKCGIVFSKNSGILSEKDVEFIRGDVQIKKTLTIGGNEESVVVGSEPGWIGDLTSYAALLVSNIHTLARLCNVTTTTGLNDDMIADCVDSYMQANDGARPDAIFMSYAARKMLRKSRNLSVDAVTDQLNRYAPIPMDFDKIPIIATNALINTEATVAAA
jgi:hypothetical protein